MRFVNSIRQDAGCEVLNMVKEMPVDRKGSESPLGSLPVGPASLRQPSPLSSMV